MISYVLKQRFEGKVKAMAPEPNRTAMTPARKNCRELWVEDYPVDMKDGHDVIAQTKGLLAETY